MSSCGIQDTRLEDYMDKTRGDSALQKLVSEIAKHGFGHLTSDMLRKRIKSTKTMYQTELMKVTESTRSGASPKEI